MNSLSRLFTYHLDDDFTTTETLTLVGLAALTALIITIVPIVNLLNFPFRLLITIVHELGHGLTALLTGGSFHNFVIAPNGSGLAYTAGGWRFLVIPAGYLGVALFAAILISLGRSHRRSRWALGIIGGAMILLSLLYGRPAVADFGAILGGVLTIMMGVILGAIFVRVALTANPGAVIFFLHLIAIKAGLTAFSDIVTVAGVNLNGGLAAHANDARSMAELTGIPAVIWALLWVVLAGLIIGGAVYGTWIHPRLSPRRQKRS